MLDTPLQLATPAGTRTVTLGTYLDPAAEERAHADAYAWIKALRQFDVGGTSFRDRFTVRDDSLWWFSEIYLHKTRAILDAHRSIAALRTLIEREGPISIGVDAAPVPLRHVAAALCARHRITGAAPPDAAEWTERRRRLDRQARRLQLFAGWTPDRFRRAPRRPSPAVAAFIHRAFWKGGGEDGAAETYIGPVLRELEAQAGSEHIHYIGIGPSTHFRAHRPGRLGPAASAVVPIERYASRRQLVSARHVWQQRRTWLELMERSSAMRESAVIEGVDCWPIVLEQLAGIAWLQWPWSVRSMDEAAAALDAVQPQAVLTYAEAGGWGRALILEARRRGIPSAGLQHGFIYRHWLNYLHEPDEMASDDISGFPRPTRTFLFDEYAAQHLRTRGRFPAQALSVTGSPRLDLLVANVRRLSPEQREQVRLRLNVTGHVVLVATKEREARAHLRAFLDAASALPDVTVIIKPHPAENANVYAEAVAGRTRVVVVDAAEPLESLLAIARVVVTVNSTVALDAGVLGVPALSIGLPNNLSPFVEAGAMAGSAEPALLGQHLRRILYDDGFRQQLADARALMLGNGAAAQGHSARRTADAVLALANRDGASQQG